MLCPLVQSPGQIVIHDDSVVFSKLWQDSVKEDGSHSVAVGHQERRHIPVIVVDVRANG